MFGHTQIWNSRWMVQVSGRGLEPGFQNWSANHQPMFLNQISDFKKLSQGFQYQSTNSDSNSRPGIKFFGREFKFSVKRFRCVTGYLKFRYQTGCSNQPLQYAFCSKRLCVIFLSPIVDVITLSFFALLHTVGALCLQNAFH